MNVMKQAGRWRNFLLGLGGLMCLLIVPVGSTFAEETQDAILQELKEIKRLLEENIKRGGIGAPKGPPASEKLDGVSVRVDGNPFKGSSTAKVSIVEFSDYQCPFCARHVRDTLPLLEKNFIATGLVKYVFRDFPLDALHPTARALGIGAACAGEQDKYWEMHDYFFEHQKDLSPGNIEDYATSLGMNMENFQACVTTESIQQAVQQDVEDGKKLGINGTPSFLFGLTNEHEKDIKAQHIFRGALPYADFKNIIEKLLNAS